VRKHTADNIQLRGLETGLNSSRSRRAWSQHFAHT